ncbi:hypothetical protein [Actinopolymorpha alba]|nr:hypothetical protein [Actinopolymorpha alba]
MQAGPALLRRWKPAPWTLRAAEAHRRLESGQSHGKILLAVAS